MPNKRNKMINVTKEFKKGEYYQTYMLLLNVRYNFETNKWIYATYMKKDEKDPWVKNKCDERKILPIVEEVIMRKLADLKISEVVEEILE